MMLSPWRGLAALHVHPDAWRTPVTTGAFLGVYLAVLYLVAMLVLWRCLWRHPLEPTPHTEVGFALQAGHTILGVMDTTTTMCFCIGTTEHAVHEEETGP